MSIDHGLPSITSRLIRPGSLIILSVLSACSSSPTARTGPAPLDTDYPPATPALNTLATALPPEPIEVTSEPGQFHIAFPCCDLARGSLLEYSTNRDLSGIQLSCHVFAQPEDGASWTVEYCDLPSFIAGKSPDELLDWWRSQVLSSAKARIENAIEEPILGEFETPIPGRAISARSNMRGLLADGTFKARIFLTSGRLYQVAARVYDANWGNRIAMIDPFLDTFYIYTTLTIPFEATPTP